MAKNKLKINIINLCQNKYVASWIIFGVNKFWS